MQKFTTYITLLFVLVLFSGLGPVQAQDDSNEKDTIRVEIELPNGTIAKADTVAEGDSLELSGLPFPLHIMNGGELAFNDSSLSHDITITITLPDFANVDALQNEVSFGDSVASGVEFTVSAGDSTISPFEFDEPVTLSMPIPEERPTAIGDQVSSLMLAYRDTTGDFDTTGIRTVARDSVQSIVKAEVSHFSDVVMTSGEIAGEDSTANTVTFEVTTPQGDIARVDSISEGQSFAMSGFSFPFQYLNGGELTLPDSAVGEDINITVEVPEFAAIDSQNNNISFGDSIASAVQFNVSVGDSAVEPYEFDTPVTLTLAIPNELPEAIANRKSDFVLAFSDSTGATDTTGIQTIEVDTANSIVTAKVDHFSTISMTTGDGTSTDIDDQPDTKPTAYKLYENYPNPFNPSTTIKYDLKEANHVTLAVYNMLGQKVATLVDKQQQSGQHQVRFDASGLSSGIYFYRINAGDYSATHKMTLVK